MVNRMPLAEQCSNEGSVTSQFSLNMITPLMEGSSTDVVM
jgi:hypothetical protein